MKRCQQVQRQLFLTLLACLCLLQCCHAVPTALAEPNPEIRVIAVSEEPSLKVITEDTIADVENKPLKIIRVNPLELHTIKNDPSGSKENSSLFKIQSLLPPRVYVNSNRMRQPKPATVAVPAAPPAAQVDNRAEASIINDAQIASESPIVLQLTPVAPAAGAIATPAVSAPGSFTADGIVGLPKSPKPSKHQMPKEQRKRLHFIYDKSNDAGVSLPTTMDVRVSTGAYPVYYVVAKTNGRFGKFPIKGFRNEAEFIKYLAKAKLHPIPRAQRFDS